DMCAAFSARSAPMSTSHSDSTRLAAALTGRRHSAGASIAACTAPTAYRRIQKRVTCEPGRPSVHRVPRATKSPARGRASLHASWRKSGREQRLHLLQRTRLDLADALGRHAVLVGQLLQRHLVFVIEP